MQLDNSNLDKLNKCVENKENLFNANSDEELSYYLKYEKYIADLKGISENYQNTSNVKRVCKQPELHKYSGHNGSKGLLVFIARRQSLHEGKEMFGCPGTKIVIPSFQCV